MRLFVALSLPEDVREVVSAQVSPRTDAEDGPRWADPEQWHLTLAFMRDIDDWRLDGLMERLARVAQRHTPMDLSLSGAGAFPFPERATVLWIGVGDASDRLRNLVRSVRGACNKAGGAPGGGRFTAHLTVGRFKRPTEATRWIRALETVPRTEWTASDLILVRSHLGEGRGGRPRHEVLESFRLGQR